MTDQIVMQVTNWPVEFGGNLHSGWLLDDATEPERTPRQTILLNIRTVKRSRGIVLEHEPVESSIEAVPPFAADTWYEAIDGAIAQAWRDFRVARDDWQRVDQ